MAQADSRVLALGALVGVAGIGLATVWYQSLRSERRRASCVSSAVVYNDEQRAAGGTMMVRSSSGGGGQAEVLARLEALIQCVSELKDEMKALKSALPTLQDHVRDELGLAEGAAAAGGGVRTLGPLHRSTPTRRKRAARRVLSTGGGAGAEGRSSEEAESEGGYITALTDSEGEESNDEGQTAEEEEEEEEEPAADDLSILLDRIDALHEGTASDKRESLDTLQEKREEFGQNSTFLWRLVRAYCDAHDVSSSLEEKKAHAETGKQVGEEAVNLNPLCADSHQWYAIMCGIMAEYDTVQNKIKNGYIFKDHLDKAIELKPQDPLSHYLLGRWCYAVAQLSWIERKVAATLFGEPPCATVQDALKHFLKAEEIRPRYSKTNFVFLAKCYRDLSQKQEARKMCDAASSMDSVSKEDVDAQKELDLLCPSLGV